MGGRICSICEKLHSALFCFLLNMKWLLRWVAEKKTHRANASDAFSHLPPFQSPIHPAEQIINDQFVGF